MKKIAIVCGTLNRGGAERVTLHLATWFATQGHDVHIITAAQGCNEYEVPAGISRHVLTKGESGMKTPWRAIRKMRQLLVENEVKSVIIMDVPTCIYAVPGSLGRGRRLIVSERSAPRHFAGKKLVRMVARGLMRLCHGYVFQTHEAQEFYVGKVKGDMAVIGNPLSVDNLPAPFLGTRAKTIVSVGRLNPPKNHALLLRAFAGLAPDYPEHKLIIYGEGDLRSEMENTIHNLGLTGRVELPGNDPNVLDKIHDASLFVLSSSFEGMPNALIEAMALGLPCVSTDCPCGGPRELIRDGENGLLTPVNDRDALERAMRQVLEDEPFAKRIGEQAVAIRNALKIENIGPQWEALL